MKYIFRDSKPGAALRHLPSGYPQVNMAWMWGALLAATMAAWLHQLTGLTAGEDILAGHGVRGGKAMIATLRWRLIAVPGELVRYARHLILRLPPGHGLLPEVLARLRGTARPRLTCASRAPAPRPCPRPASPETAERPQPSEPGTAARAVSMPATGNPGTPRSITKAGPSSPRYSRNRV